MKIDCLSTKDFFPTVEARQMDGLSSNTLIFIVEIEEIMILSCLKSKVLSMV